VNRSSRSNDQLNLPPSLLTNVSHSAELRNKVSQDQELTPDQAEILTAQLFDGALTLAKISSKEVAILLGVGTPLVSKWRSPEYREQPSFAQMLRLPVTFHIALHREMNRRFGFGRAAIKRLLDAVGDLMAVSE
jgi:hypothetical protein